jgi:branched-chain amino acid transport system ATP-binding protein
VSGSKGLVVRDLTVRYGGVVANSHVDLVVEPGQVVGLIGPNGAGKTTLIDAVSGFTPCEGEVTLDGRPLSGLGPHERRRHGLSRTWQSGELFGNLSVRSNVAVAATPGGVTAAFRDVFGRRRRRDEAAVDHVLAAVGLEDTASLLARDLPVGQQKLVGVARALVGSCALLLLDEPAAGLDSRESLQFADRVPEITASGPGVLLVDHDMSLVMDVCHRIYVMEFGRVIFSGTPQEALADDRVIAAYLGAPMESTDA